RSRIGQIGSGEAGAVVPLEPELVRMGVPLYQTSSGSIGTTATASPETICPILDLTLGPLDLNLLGLMVHLDQVHLTITADDEGGILGQLLCGIGGGGGGSPGS